MDAPTTQYARARDGAYLAYQSFGDGPTDLLYLAGWHSHLEIYWEMPQYAALMRRLAERFRVITFDKRGTGLSERNVDTVDFETMMDDVRTVLDATGSERVVLWGDGADGGGTCAVFAASLPARVLALVWWQALARTTASADYPWGQPEENATADPSFIEEVWGDERRAADLLDFVGASSVIGDRAAERWIAKFYRHAGTPNAANAFHSWYMGIDVRAMLPSIHVPSLLVHTGDAESRATDEAHGRYLASRIPGAVSAWLQGEDFPAWLGDQEANLTPVLSFVESVRREEQELDRVLATVLFSDIVGSTDKASELGDAAWRELLRQHHAAVRALLGRYRGTEIKTTGDGFLATFDGPARAARCAQAMCEAVKPLGLELRAGCHTGEIELMGADVGGIAVHIAARVSALAAPSQVLVSSTLKDLVAGSGLAFDDCGEHRLKGVPDTWRLFALAGPTASAAG